MDISALSAAFTSFINTLTSRPLYTIIGSFMLSSIAGLGMLVYVGFTDPPRTFALFESFVSIVVPAPVPVLEPIPVPIPPEEEAKRLQESIPRDALTCAAIDELGFDLKADRVTYSTFSNGSYGLGGVPFNYANVHCPFVADGIAPISEDLQKIPNSIAAETNAVLFPNFTVTGCGHWTTDDIHNTFARAIMKQVGTGEMLQCGVRDGRGIPIGKIVVSWRNVDKSRDWTPLTAKVRDTADAIGHYNTPTVPVEELNKR